jgi:hypothetical protein
MYDNLRSVNENFRTAHPNRDDQPEEERLGKFSD